MKLKGTKTEKNLLAAFAGESQARNRYTFFASVAKKEGYEQIAAILIELARRTPSTHGRLADDPIVRQQIARFTARVQAASLLSQAAMARRASGHERAMDVPLTKLGFAILNEDLSHYGITIQGAYGMLATDSPYAIDGGSWQDELLYAKAYTISGGSNQVMQNLIGERALGLPREPKPA